MSKTIVGVMGPGAGATAEDVAAAYELGRLIAQEGWVLLTGGRDAGVMDAASRGAKEAGGLTVGVLPTDDLTGVSPFVDIPVLTGMGQARNQINALTSRVLIACGTGAGTASEIALALKARKRVILIGGSREGRAFFKSLGGDAVLLAGGPRQAVEAARGFMTGGDNLS